MPDGHVAMQFVAMQLESLVAPSAESAEGSVADAVSTDSDDDDEHDGKCMDTDN